jgi:NAD(P)H-hydrate epimerase
MEGRTCVAMGCGLSLRCAPGIVRAVLESGLPAVLDADALTLIARDDSLKALLSGRHLVTPHPGEAKRLLGRELTDPITDARALNALGPAVILKGAASVIASDRGTFISASGCPGMAKGGSGDALAGIAGALIAQGLEPGVAAYFASELHGLAGEAAQEEFGERGMLTTDLIEMISEVML